MRMVSGLGEVEQRVLGALLEKEQATPEYYPLTVNALLAACNQKSNRQPVLQLTETQVIESLERLRRDTLVWRTEGPRSEKWSQSVSRRLELNPGEKAALTLLLLRGPQTPGELRSRSGRLHDFQQLSDVETALREMAVEERELVVQLERVPGQKEARWAHLLGGRIEGVEQPAPPPAATVAPSPDRLGDLERRVTELEARLLELSSRVETTDES